MDNLQENNLVEQNNEIPFVSVQHNVADIPITVAEINHLWSTYMAESMACCFQKHIIALISHFRVPPTNSCLIRQSIKAA